MIRGSKKISKYQNIVQSRPNLLTMYGSNRRNRVAQETRQNTYCWKAIFILAAVIATGALFIVTGGQQTLIALLRTILDEVEDEGSNYPISNDSIKSGWISIIQDGVIPKHTITKKTNITKLVSEWAKPALLVDKTVKNWSIFKWDLFQMSKIPDFELEGTRWQPDPVFVLGNERDRGGMIGSARDQPLVYTNVTLSQFLRSAISKTSDREGWLYWTGLLRTWQDVLHTSMQTDSGRSDHESSDPDPDISTEWKKFRIEDIQVASPGTGKEGDAGDIWQPMLWLSHPGVVAQTHYDTQHNVFIQLQGFKRMLLFPPGTELYSYPSIHRSYRQSQVHLEEPRPPHWHSVIGNDGTAARESAAGSMRNQHHPFSRVDEDCTKAYSVALGPGDVLYIPPYWQHRVESVTLSLSLSVLSPSATEALLSEAFWQQVPFGEFQASRALRELAVRTYLSCLLHSMPASFATRLQDSKTAVQDSKTEGDTYGDGNIVTVSIFDADQTKASQLLGRFSQRLFETRFQPLQQSRAVPAPRYTCAAMPTVGSQSIPREAKEESRVDVTGERESQKEEEEQQQQQQEGQEVEEALELLQRHRGKFLQAAREVASRVSAADEALATSADGSSVMLLFLGDYAEQIVRWAVGPKHTGSFIRDCLH